MRSLIINEQARETGEAHCGTETQEKRRRLISIGLTELFAFLTCFLIVSPAGAQIKELITDTVPVVSKNTLVTAITISLVIAVMALWRHRSLTGLTRHLRGEIAERKKAEEVLKDISERKLAEDKIRQSDAKYRNLFESSTDGIFILDFDGNFIDVNTTAYERLGYTKEEMLALHISKLAHREFAAQTTERMRQIREDGFAVFESAHLRKDGTAMPVEVNSRLMEFEGKPAHFSMIRDITERRKAEDALRESEERYHLLFEGSADGILIADIETKKFKYANPAVCRMFGFSEEEIQTMGVADIHPKTELAHAIAEFEAQARGDKILASDIPCVRKEGTIFYADISTVKNTIDGKACNVGFFRDVTERKGAADAMKKSEQRLNEAQKTAHTGDWEWELATNKVHWSEELYRIYGFEPRSIAPDYGLVLAQMHPASKDEFLKAIDAALKEDRHFEMDYRFFRKNGVEAVLHTIGQVIRDASGAPVRMQGIVQDVTESKKAEELIHRSLREKEVLLKEIHHRVKNNMQVIYSLLNLQAKATTDKSVRAMFEESRDRVNSMALIHEKLYSSDDLAHIDFKEYLRSLVGGIANTYKRHDVSYDLDMEQIAIDINVGIPCGLIVNELVSNSLKYAFPGGKKGAISLGINKNSEGNNVLFVADNGIGFPAEVDFRNTLSLGLKLVNVLTGQIRGTIELSRNEGTRFTITFPGNSKEPPSQNG